MYLVSKTSLFFNIVLILW